MKYATKANARRAGGFARASGVLDRQIATVVQKRGFSATRLLTHWRDIVGHDIANHAKPIAIKYARAGLATCLKLLVDGANAPQIQMQIPQIIERANAFYGFNAIQTITLIQSSASPNHLAEDAPPFERAVTESLSVQTIKNIDNLVQPVADGELRCALATLGQNIVRKQRKDFP